MRAKLTTAMLATVWLAAPAVAQDIVGVAYRGDVAAVTQMLGEDASLARYADAEGRTALHGAVAGGAVEIVRLLLARGADVNARDYEEHTPLHFAALRSEPDAARLLVEAGADLEARNDYGRTPLLLVAREAGNRDMAALLLELGAEVDARDEAGATPLTLAAWRGFRSLVDLLLDSGAQVPSDARTVQGSIGLAIGNGLDRLFTLLVERGADLTAPNDNGGTLLHSACEGGSVAIASRLLDEGLDPGAVDRYGWTPLHYAADRGRNGIIELLVRAGVPLDVRNLAGDSPVNVARDAGRAETVELLLASGADPAPPAFPVLEGPYLGQTPPGVEPVLFAPEIVASHRFEHCVVTFSPNADEAFWGSSFQPADSGYTTGIILMSRLEQGRWTRPEPAPFSTELRYGEGEPFVSPDGERVYFISMRPDPGGTEGQGERIWYADRTERGWSEPRLIDGGPNARELHWQFSVAANGNIYTGSNGDILVSRFQEDRWTEPEPLGAAVNTEQDEGSPFIAPDESYLIFVRGRNPPRQQISFRDRDGWTAPRDLGDPVNTAGSVCTSISPDGRYVFFHGFQSGNADVYWVDARVVGELRRE